jgi:steroid delta-isomerase-like uncharacterized protein
MSFAQTYLEAWSSRKGEKVAELMAQDATFEDLALGVLHRGRAEIAAFVAETVTMSPDVSFTLVSEQESGDQYCIEWEMTGTQSGEAAGLPATNKPYRIRGVSVGVLGRAG